MATRKGFNFYASYYEVMETLSDKEAIQYLKALIEREFNGTEPNLLKMLPMAKFAYVSQRHSIDAQVHGFEQKTKEPLTPICLSRQGASVQEKGQVQVKGEEKEEVKEQTVLDFDAFWVLYDKKVGNKDVLKKKFELTTEEDRDKMLIHIPEYKKSQPDKKFRKDPSTYLHNQAWNDEIIVSSGQQPLFSQQQPKISISQAIKTHQNDFVNRNNQQ